MIRHYHPLNGLVCLGLYLTSVTACGKRVDDAAREEPVARRTHEIQQSAPHRFPQDEKVQRSSNERTAAPEKKDALIRLTAGELLDVVRTAHRRGTLINVWATWCGPCREELPMLAKVHRAYEGKKIAVLPISVDEPEKEHLIASMLKGYGFDGPFYVATRPLDELKTTLSAEWPGNIPVTFLLDSMANRKYFWTAQVYEEELTPKLDQFLRGELESGKSNFGVAPGKTY